MLYPVTLFSLLMVGFAAIAWQVITGSPEELDNDSNSKDGSMPPIEKTNDYTPGLPHNANTERPKPEGPKDRILIIRAFGGKLKTLPDRLKTLTESSKTLPDRLKTLTGSSKTLPDRLKTLTGSLKTLSDGLKTLTGSSKTLPDRLKTLTGSSKTLPDRLKTLSDGLKTLTGRLKTRPDNLKTLRNKPPINFNTLSYKFYDYSNN